MTIFKKEIPIQIIRLSIIGVFIIAIVAFKTISSNIINTKIDKILGGAKAYITYGDTSMDLFGFDVHIHDIKLNIPNQKPLVVDEMVIKSFDMDNAVPRYMNIKLKGIQTDLAMLRSNQNLAAKLDILELKEITSNLAINYKFDKDQKMLDVKDLTLQVDNAGKISYKTKLYNIVAMEYFPMQINLAPQTIKFGTTSLHYEDDSFMEHMMKMNAQDANQTVFVYKEAVLKRMQANLDTAKANSQSYEIQLDEAMIAFVKQPKSFDFGIEPAQPVSLIMLNEANSRDNMLKILQPTISAN